MDRRAIKGCPFEINWQLLRTEHAHQLIGTGFGENGRIRGDFTVELPREIELHILQGDLCLIRFLPLFGKKNNRNVVIN